MHNVRVNLSLIQDQIVSRGRNGEKRVKLTPSLYDTPIHDRTYWGNDAGSEIAMATGRTKISKCIRQGKLFDVEDHIVTRRLNREYITELKQFQMMLIEAMEKETEHQIIIVSGDDGEWYLQFIL